MNKTFILDVETDSLDARKAKLTGIGLQVDDTVEFLTGNYDKIIPLISEPTNTMVGHGLLYDVMVLRCNGFDIKCKLWDTMGASWLIDENKSHQLKDLAKSEFGLECKKFKNIKPEELEEYGKNDIKLTKLLYDRYKPIMDKDYPIFYNLYQPLLKAINAMQSNGITIDTYRMEGLYWEIKDSVESLEESLKEEIAKHTDKEVNVRSPKQLRVLLFDTIGLKPIKTSKKTKEASTDAKTLEILSKKGSNLSALLLRHREKAKLLSTYIKPIVEKLEDGRLHTEYNPFGTRTGRFNSKNPNLQNIPVKDKGLIRSAFIASPGHKLIIADYSQIELRILAHMSKDERLLYAYNNNLDIHTKTASSIFGVQYEQVTKEQRYIAKAINFGLIYGMTKYRLAEEAHINIWKAQDYIDKYFKIYSGVATWRKEAIEQCMKDKFIQTLFGRYRRLPDITSNMKAARQAVNSIVQGSAGDVINKATVELYKKFDGSSLKSLMQIHDELVNEAPIEEADKYAREIKDIMENVVKLEIPLKVNVQVAENWSEK